MAGEFNALSAIDLGYGTGILACRLAGLGKEVIGVEPAAASLKVANRKMNADKVRCIHGSIAMLTGLQVDLITMTGNVAQVFVTDDEWMSTLRACCNLLNPSGRLVFEVRDPSKKAWEYWTKEKSFKVIEKSICMWRYQGKTTVDFLRKTGDSTMTQGWQDPVAARAWDTNGDNVNPTRAEQLDILISVLAEFSNQGEWILDLGYGSGKVEEVIFERIPDSQVVGIDNSPAMAQLASTRLARYANRFVPIHGDLAQLSNIQLPVAELGAVIAIQSLHHLSAQDMQNAYRHIHNLLRPGGVFLLLDRLKVENEFVFPLLRSVWKRLDSYHGTATAPQEGENFDEHKTKLQEEGDVPVILETHLDWLRACTFHAVTLHVHGNRGLIAAVKK